MRGRLPHTGAVRSFRQLQQQSIGRATRRTIRISATPTTDSPILSGDVLSNAIEASADAADARFEVLGAPFSLLSVSLSASQKLYTRRGTLVGVSGKAENTQSTLSILEPIRRALFGIPFLYQRVTSTSPITALISTKSPLTSFHILHLNGTVDYMIAQRKALLAWTGHTLSVSPTVNTKLNLAHWGNTEVTGRGLVALAGPGQIYEINLRAGEEYVAYPGNVVAYTITQHLPQPYRFKSSNLRFQIPSLGLGRLVRDVKFFRVMKETNSWRTFTGLLYSIRTAARRTIWGDRLFLKFQGPTTILVSSRASRISDVLTARDVNEIADVPAGAVEKAVVKASTPVEEIAKKIVISPTKLHVAEVGKDGSVKIKNAESAGESVQS